jgi:hypothetical protein
MQIKSGGGTQRRLWDDLVVNPLPAVKLVMNEVMKGLPVSREQLAEDMNRLAVAAGLGLKVSKAVLDKWLNPAANGYQPTLAGLLLFCLGTGDMQPLAVYVKAFSGVRLVSDHDYQLLQWAKAERAARQAKRQARQLAPKAGVE